MTQQTGGDAWTRKDGLCALKPIPTSRDSGEMIDPSESNGVWLLEEGKCCAASEPSYTNQPATCRNVNWWSTLDGWVIRILRFFKKSVNDAREKFVRASFKPNL